MQWSFESILLSMNSPYEIFVILENKGRLIIEKKL